MNDITSPEQSNLPAPRRQAGQNAPQSAVDRCIRLLVEGEKSNKEIAQDCGLAEPTVTYYSKKLNIKPPTYWATQRRKIIENNIEVAELARSELLKEDKKKEIRSADPDTLSKISERHYKLADKAIDREENRGKEERIFNTMPHLVLIKNFFSQ